MALSNQSYRNPKSRMLLGAAFISLALSTPAAADTATQEGAKAISDGFARYLGKALMDKGVVVVKLNGDHYDLTYEVSSAKLGIPADGPQIQFGPGTVQVTPKSDGIFAFTFNQPELDLTYTGAKAGEPLEFAEHLKNCVGEGTFDARTLSFPNQTGTCESGVLTMRSPTEDVDAKLGKASFVVTSKVTGNGDIDTNMTGDLFDMVETITMKDPRTPMPPVVLRSDKVHEEAAFAGVRNTQLLEALAFFVSGQLNSGGKAGKDEGKAKLKAALPLWESGSAEIRYDNLTVGTPKGIVKIASVDTNVASSGLVDDGNLGMALKMTGLELPDGMVPDWAKTLVPANAMLDLKLTGLDLDTLADQVIESIAAKTPSDLHFAIQAAIASILFNGKQHLTFNQTLTAPAYDVKGQGQTTLAPSQQGTATISASNLDGIIAALGNAGASMPRAQQGLMGLAFLKGLAKSGPDGRLVWDVDFDSLAKKVTVNGQSFGPGAK